MTKEEKIWDEACKATLKSISESFQDEKYLSKIPPEFNVPLFKIFGKNILNFPIPEYKPKKTKTKK